MKIKKLLFLVFFCANAVYAQSFEFGWLTDIHIGFTGADRNLSSIVNDLNNRNQVQFVVASGDISEQGKREQLLSAKGALDSLKMKYYMIPGNHDSKWSAIGSSVFKEFWNDTKFSFTHEGITVIGLNSSIPLKGGGGHIAPEDLSYLDGVLSKLDKQQPIILFLHHPLDQEVDNWYKVTNRLRGHKVLGILVGHGHVNKIYSFGGFPAAMGRSVLPKNVPGGYNIVKVYPDSLSFTEIRLDSTLKNWGSLEALTDTPPAMDSMDFKNYNANIIWQKDLNFTMVSSVVSDGKRVVAALKNGVIQCFDTTGKLLWKYSSGGTITGRPAIYKDLLVYGTIEGDLSSIDMRSGTVLQTMGLGEPVTSQIVVFDYEGNKRLMAGGKPGAVVAAGTLSGKMYCYDLNTFELVWENEEAQGMIETKPLLSANKLIYGSWDGFLYAIDSRSGVTIWKWTENKNFYFSPAACTPVTDGKFVYVATPDKFVSAIDINLGRTLWRKNDALAWESIGISEDGSKLLIKSYSDKFVTLNPRTGNKIGEVDLKTGIDTMPIQPIESNGNIIFGQKNGRIIMIDNKNKAVPLLFTGTARTHTVERIGSNLFAASNMDGKIFLFKINRQVVN